MKLPCQTVKDLLPLYHDGVCSDESRSLVEDHIFQCESCKKELDILNSVLEPSTYVTDDSAVLRSLHKQWSKSLAVSFVKGIIITCMICAALFGICYLLTQWHCIPVSPEVLEITNVCQMEDGPILYHLSVNDSKNLHLIKSTITEDGALYMTPMHAILEGSSDRRFGEFGSFNDDHMVDLEWIEEGFGGEKITSVYIGPVGNGILIWQEGMELPPASKEQEDAWGPLHEAATAD